MQKQSQANKPTLVSPGELLARREAQNFASHSQVEHAGGITTFQIPEDKNGMWTKTIAGVATRIAFQWRNGEKHTITAIFVISRVSMLPTREGAKRGDLNLFSLDVAAI